MYAQARRRWLIGCCRMGEAAIRCLEIPQKNRFEQSVEGVTQPEQMQVHTIIWSLDAGIRDVLKTVGDFVLAVAAKAESHTKQRAELKCS